MSVIPDIPPIGDAAKRHLHFFYLRFEPLDAPLTCGSQASHLRRPRAPPPAQVADAGGHGSGDSSLRADSRFRSDDTAGREPCLAHHYDEVADCDSRRDADLATDRAIRADNHVVRNRGKGTDLSPPTNQCAGLGTALDDTVGSDSYEVSNSN